MIGTKILKIDLEIAEIIEVKVSNHHLEIDILLLHRGRRIISMLKVATLISIISAISNSIFKIFVPIIQRISKIFQKHPNFCNLHEQKATKEQITKWEQFYWTPCMFNCLCILMFVDSLVSKHQRLVYCRHFKNGKGTGRHHIKFCEYHFTNIDVKIGEDQLSPVTKLGLGWGRGGVLLPLSLSTATLLSHFRPKTGNSADKDQTQFWPLLQGRQASGQTVSSNGINKATSA